MKIERTRKSLQTKPHIHTLFLYLWTPPHVAKFPSNSGARTDKRSGRMKLSPVHFSLEFGKLGKIYGQYKFTLAPNEQRVFKGFWKDATIKVLRNTWFDRWYLWLPQGVVFYFMTKLCVKMNYEAYRKKPEDFINEGISNVVE
ncbi:UcrQ family protein [Loa loa]|uniref:Cytochrome b-c1 complex subunit 8 n=2 Tax=Loa loa TaxID=7209 RepID=A0A1S0TY50_LOALO|nr:UcrQ family protein [Loa loa]EFO22149.2 UcrQ family protein [Loa loa]